MAQVAFEQIKNEWVELSDIITVDADVTYFIQNRGNDKLIACEGSAKPESAVGIFVEPYKALKYKKGTDSLYLRAFADNCFINISSEA